MLDVVRHQLAHIELRIEQLTAARDKLDTILDGMEAATQDGQIGSLSPRRRRPR